MWTSDVTAELPLELIWLAVLVPGVSLPRARAAAWRLALTMPSAYLVAMLYSLPAAWTALSVGAALGTARMWTMPSFVWWLLAALLAARRLHTGSAAFIEIGVGAAIGIAIALWVLGGRHPATYSRTLPDRTPPQVVIRP